MGSQTGNSITETGVTIWYDEWDYIEETIARSRISGEDFYVLTNPDKDFSGIKSKLPPAKPRKFHHRLNDKHNRRNRK